MTETSPDRRPPKSIRRAGAIVAVQGAAAVVIALVLVIRGFEGAGEAFISSYGTAAWFAILGGGVLAGGIALITGRRWGRAIAVVAQILLLPVSYALIVDSDQPAFGIPLLVVVLAALALLFSPSSVAWLSSEYAPDAVPDPGPADDAPDSAAPIIDSDTASGPAQKPKRRR